MKITTSDGRQVTRLAFLRPRPEGVGAETAAAVDVGDQAGFAVEGKGPDFQRAEAMSPMGRAQFVGGLAAKYADCTLFLEVVGGDVAVIYPPGSHPTLIVGLDQ